MILMFYCAAADGICLFFSSFLCKLKRMNMYVSLFSNGLPHTQIKCINLIDAVLVSIFAVDACVRSVWHALRFAACIVLITLMPYAV